MRKINFKVVAMMMLLFFSIQLKAVPASPFPVTIQQSNGTSLTIILNGDEHFHYYTTVDGFLIKKGKEGLFKYALIDEQGNVVTTDINAKDLENRNLQEQEFLKTIPQHPDFSKRNKAMRVKRLMYKAPRAITEGVSKSDFPRTGSPHSLVILASFSDVPFTVTNPQKAFTNQLNEENYSVNGATGSARDYFKAVSMGTFSPHFDVVGPYTLPHSQKYYGENDADGQDENAVQMVVDACRLANENGVDFTKYDTDKDGYIDNVFVYYAGHNEAERAPSETVWPHRWSVYPEFEYGVGGSNYNGDLASITFDGKRLFDYACTSELKNSSGTTMCGIATFSHEFGHVLGLADMYTTNGATHHTLSKWSIMDQGTYLNGGNTPPAYNTFERFQLGYITPTLLTTPINAVLQPLSTSNEAYLISSENSHNLIGDNPKPEEYFLLENRQKEGWDKYLPGHGMLIYRIYWNKNDMYSNTPNNDPDRMVVDIIEADGIASNYTLGGDPFPGRSFVTDYTPQLRDGTELSDKNIKNISEQNKLISFRYRGGGLAPMIKEAQDITYKSFVASWEPVYANGKLVNGYYLTVVQKNNDGTTDIIIDEKWITNTSDTIYNLISSKEYEFFVKSSYIDDVTGTEMISSSSDTMTVKTLKYPYSEKLRVTVNKGVVKVYLPQEQDLDPKNPDNNGIVQVYNILGQPILMLNTTEEVVTLDKLPKNMVLIIRSGKQRKKILLH